MKKIISYPGFISKRSNKNFWGKKTGLLLFVLFNLSVNLFSQVKFESYSTSSIKNIGLVNGVSYSHTFTGDGSDRTIHITFTASRSFDYSNIIMVYGFVTNGGKNIVYSNYMQCNLLESQEIRETFPEGIVLSGYLVFYDKTINGSAGYNGYSSFEEQLKYRPFVCDRERTRYNATKKIIKEQNLSESDFSSYLRSITPAEYCQ